MPDENFNKAIAKYVGIPVLMSGTFAVPCFTVYSIWQSGGWLWGDPTKREMLRAYHREGDRPLTVDEVHQKMMSGRGVDSFTALVEAKATDVNLSNASEHAPSDGYPQLPYLLRAEMEDRYETCALRRLNQSCAFALEGRKHKIGVEATVRGNLWNDLNAVMSVQQGQSAFIQGWGPWKTEWPHMKLRASVKKGDTVLAWGTFRRIDTDDVIRNAMETCEKMDLATMREHPVWLLPNDTHGWTTTRFHSFELMNHDVATLLKKDQRYREESKAKVIWGGKGLGWSFAALILGAVALTSAKREEEEK